MVSGIRFVEQRKSTHKMEVIPNAHDPWTGVLNVRTLALGMSRRCGTYLALEAAPFFDVESSGTAFSRACTPAQVRLRELLSAWLPPRRDDAALAVALRKPDGGAEIDQPSKRPPGVRVVYWDRTDLKKNGRVVVNKAVLVDALEAVCETAQPGVP